MAISFLIVFPFQAANMAILFYSLDEKKNLISQPTLKGTQCIQASLLCVYRK